MIYFESKISNDWKNRVSRVFNPPIIDCLGSCVSPLQAVWCDYSASFLTLNAISEITVGTSDSCFVKHDERINCVFVIRA